MSISQIKANARQALSGKWGKGACIVLAYLAFYFVIGFITGLFGEESMLGSIVNLASIIIQVPVTFGLSYAIIKLKRNEEVEAFDFLELGFSNFGRAWKIGLRALLKVIVPFIVMIVSVFMFAFSLAATIFTSAFNISEPSIGLALVGLVGLIIYVVSIIWLAISSLLYSLTTYIAYDNPNMTSLEVVNESAKMMKGNRIKIFVLELSFIGWAILTVFTLGIGYLWLLPYMQVSVVCFYESLVQKNHNSNVESDTEVIKEY